MLLKAEVYFRLAAAHKHWNDGKAEGTRASDAGDSRRVQQGSRETRWVERTAALLAHERDVREEEEAAHQLRRRVHDEVVFRGLQHRSRSHRA